MSKNSGGYMGVQVGKLGPAIGSMWKGRNVFRAYNPFVKNPRTEKQQLNRAVFKTLTELASAFAQASNHGYKRLAYSLRTTTRGLFMRDNKAAVHANSVESVTVDYAELKISDGELPNVQFGAPHFDDPQTVQVAWETNEEVAGADLADIVGVFVYCPDAKCGVMAPLMGQNAAKRDDKTIAVLVPAYWSGMKVHVWGFCKTAVEEPTYIDALGGYVYPNQCSDSVYVGTGNIG